MATSLPKWLNEVWMLRLLLEQLLQSTIYVPSCVKLFTLPLEWDCKIKSFPTHRYVDVEENG